MCCLRKGKIHLSIVIKQMNVRERAKPAVSQPSTTFVCYGYILALLVTFQTFFQEKVKLKVIH